MQNLIKNIPIIQILYQIIQIDWISQIIRQIDQYRSIIIELKKIGVVQGCINLKNIEGLENFYTSKIITMAYVFYDCEYLKSNNI